MNLPSFAVGLGEVAFEDQLAIPPSFAVSSVVEADSTDLRSHSDSSTKLKKHELKAVKFDRLLKQNILYYRKFRRPCNRCNAMTKCSVKLLKINSMQKIRQNIACGDIDTFI